MAVATTAPAFAAFPCANRAALLTPSTVGSLARDSISLVNNYAPLASAQHLVRIRQMQLRACAQQMR